MLHVLDGKARFLEGQDPVQGLHLAHGVIPVAAFPVDLRGQEQALFLVKAEGLYGDPVHLGKQPDPVQVIRRLLGAAVFFVHVHFVFLLALSFTGRIVQPPHRGRVNT